MSSNKSITLAVELYASGLSMNAVGKKLGVRGQTVERWLEGDGVAIRKRRPTYPVQVKEQAISMYITREMSCAAVAAVLGLKPFTVKEWVSSAGAIRTMSEAASLSVASGTLRSKASSRLWYRSNKTGEEYFAESSLEYLRMQQLDADADVSDWSRCSLRIPYVSPNGRRRSYVPDLLVLDRFGNVWVEEIKPLGLVSDDVNQAKFRACISLCRNLGWGFVILTESEVGYVRSLAPSSLSKEQRQQRQNHLRRKRFASETETQRAERLAKNAAYMRKFNARRSARAARTSTPPC